MTDPGTETTGAVHLIETEKETEVVTETEIETTGAKAANPIETATNATRITAAAAEVTTATFVCRNSSATCH